MKIENAKVKQTVTGKRIQLPIDVINKMGGVDKCAVFVAPIRHFKWKLFKEHALFPQEALEQIDKSSSSSYACMIFNYDDAHEIHSKIVNSNLKSSEKSHLISYIFGNMSYLNKGASFEVPLYANSYFSSGDFVVCSSQGKVEVWDKNDFEMMKTFITEKRAKKVVAKKATSSKKKDIGVAASQN